MLIGWRISDFGRVEAWLGEISPEEAAGDHSTNDHTATVTEPITTDLLRVYTTFDGAAETINGIMGVDIAHRAVLNLETAIQSFLQLGSIDRLKRVEHNMHSVRMGRWKYCEREGGELMALDWVEGELGERVEKAPQKGKRDRNSAAYSPTPSVEVRVRKRSCRGKSPEKEDDDDDDVEDDIACAGSTKNENPPEPGSIIKEQLANRSTKFDGETEDSLSPSFDKLSFTQAAVKDDKEADQKKPPTPRQLAEALRDDVIRLAGTLSKPAQEHKVTLTECVDDILDLIRRIVLPRINFFRGTLTIDFRAKEKSLQDAEARKKPDAIIAAHKQLVLKYKINEANARKIYTELKTRNEDLETMLAVEKYAPK